MVAKKNGHVVAAFLAVVSGVCVLASAGAANADETRRGVYIGVELGFANPSDLVSTMSGINHPTECDQVLRDVDPTNVVDLNNSVCDVGDTPRALSNNSFDLSVGFLGGFNVGYALDRFRVEFEYLNRRHDGDASLHRAAETVLAGKSTEWSENSLPSERISDFSAHQFFLNAYYDFMNASRWTPYVGAGVGWAYTSMRYDNRFIRKTTAEGYPTTKPPAAAGTISFLDTDISDTIFGFQFMGGADYALTEKVSIGLKGRWATFGDINHGSVWNLIRSHKPVQADGTTPFTTKLELDDVEYWALTLGLKYHF